MWNIIVILRKIKTILILISFKRYFSHPEKSILNLVGGIVIPGQIFKYCRIEVQNRRKCLYRRNMSTDVMIL